MAKMTAAQAAVLGDGKGRRDAGLRRARAPRSTRSTAALRKQGTIGHILARHVEGASHMAEGYTRAVAGNIGVCIGTSGPAGTDMITGLYSAQADSIPILCITGQAPRARLYKEDFQAVDIESIAKPVTKWAVTVREPAQVPRAFQQAFHLMRSGRPGPGADRPALRRADGRDRVRPRHLLAAAGLQAGRHAARRSRRRSTCCRQAERPLIVAGGGIINADARDLLVEFAELTGVPVIPTLMGWGAIPDDHPLMAGMCGLQTSHRYGNATMLASDFVLGIGNRWANRHTGSVRGLLQGPQVRARGHRAHPDRPRVRARLRHRVRRQGGAASCSSQVARERKAAGTAAGPRRLGRRSAGAQAHDAAQDQLRRRADEAAARLPSA